MRAGGVLALAVVLLAGATACSDAEDDYCTTFLEKRQELVELGAEDGADGAPTAEAGTDVLTPTLAAFEEVRAVAPDEVRDEWDTLVFAYRDLADAVEASGIDPAEFAPNSLPEGLDPADRKRLRQVAGRLGSTRVTEAAQGVESHASTVCREAEQELDDELGGDPADEPADEGGQ